MSARSSFHGRGQPNGSAARRVKRCGAISSICCSMPGALAAKHSSCSASTLTPILSAVLPTSLAAQIER
jgi:hypothetical protein